MPTNKPEVVLPDWAIAAAFRELDNCQNHSDKECGVYNEIFNRALEKHRADTLTRPAAGEFVMVPREPTKAMVAAGNEASDWHIRDADDVYRAMLSAAPQQGGQEVVAYLTEDEVYGGTRRGLEFADCGTRRPGVSYYPLTHMHPQPAMPGIAWEAFSALEDVPFGEHASAKHFIRPYLQGGDVLGWRMVGGIRVFGIVPASGLLPRQDFVRYDDFLSATRTQPQQPVEAVYLIKGDFDLWKEQTKAEHDWWDGKQNAPARRVLYTTPPPAIDIGKLRQIAAELRDNAHAHRQECRDFGIFADEQEAQFNEELAERIEATLIGDGGERANG
jgi:hypothetical protein